MSAADLSSDRIPVIASHAPAVRLSVLKGPGAGNSIVLRRVASIIGARAGCKVRLQHANVSRVHCAIVNTGDEVFLRDLVSRHGTYLNDLRAEHERLEDGDVIKIRPWELRLSIVTPTTSDTSDITGLGLEPAPTAVALEDLTTRRVIKMPREVSLVGRRDGCDFVLDDRSVSRAQAVIFTYLSSVTVLDLGSQNGTWVNGEQIAIAKLQPDDLLNLGAPQFRVRIVEPSPLHRRSGSGNGQVVHAPTPDGTVSDRIDIRAAEVDRR